MSSDRRVFVLAGSGEVGPFTVEDLRREVAAGRIQRADQVRTATGKVLGTVGEQIGGAPAAAAHAHVSGRMPSAIARSERHRAVESRHHAPAPSDEPPDRRWLALVVIAAVLVVVVYGALWALKTPAPTPPPPPAPVAPAVANVVPQIRLSAVTEVADAKLGVSGLVRIAASVASTTDLPLQVQISGTATDADFKALPTKVVLAAGTTVIDLPIVAKPVSSERSPARQVMVRLMPGAGYLLGGGIHATVTLATAVVAPSLAFEDFAPRDPYTALGGQGWNGPWLGVGMEFLPGALAVSGSGQNHARIPASKQFRPLARRIASGTVWLSFVANAPVGGQPVPMIESSPWSALGPFTAATRGEAFATAFFDESKPIDLAQEQRGKRWVAHPEWRDGAINGLTGESCANYVYRTITVAQLTTLPLVIGSDDTLTVWLNGEQQLAHEIYRAIDSEPEHLSLQLKPGRNALLMKIVNGDGGTAFYCRDQQPGTVLGLSLYDSGQEQLFIGCSMLRRGLSVEYSPHAEQQFTVLPTTQFKQGTRLVVRLDLAGDHTDVGLWVDPQPGEPPPAATTTRINGLAFDQVRLTADRGMTWEVGDLRLGSTWDEVVPR